MYSLFHIALAPHPSPHRTFLFMALSSHHHHHHHHHHRLLHLLPPTSNPPKIPPSHLSTPAQTLKQAFLSLNRSSQQDPPHPISPEAYASILELCACHNALLQGQQIHARILASVPFSTSAFLTTKLLFMYGKCGQPSAAQQMFDEMPHRTIFSWNALIGSYASENQALKAIELYHSLRVSGWVMPDAHTFASVLKACAAYCDVYCGREIHGAAIKSGFVSAVFVANALVAMYAKCGWYGAARQLFEWMAEGRDVVSWNSIITASLQAGKFSESLAFFREMVKAGVSMNSYTVVGVLQACAELSLLNLGKEIHASILKCKPEFDIYEANALVVMYTRCCRMRDAKQIYSKISKKDNVSLNSLLSGYVQNGLYEEAIAFFFEMVEMGFKPDQVSVVSIASALGRSGNFLSCRGVHAYATKQCFDSDLQVGNTFIDMYTRCRSVNYAQCVFSKMPENDFISWTAIISAYAQNSCYLEAVELFREAQRVGVKVDPMMIGSILIACGGLACLPLLKQIHGYAIRYGLLDLVLGNTMIDVYGDCEYVDYAFQLFQRIRDKDVVSWTSMISCYVHNGLLNDALGLFVGMEKANVEPDVVALASILSAAAGLSSLSKGKEIHGFLIRRCFSMDGSIYISLVDMYARCGSINKALRLFDRTICKDLILWTAMINACGMNGLGKEAIHIFRRMLEIGLVPDHVTFLALLYACSHSGLVDEGKMYLEKMIHEYRLEPWADHYACVVDLLGRSGKMNEAYEFIKAMPIQPTAAIWCSLLGACQVYSNSELGEVAAEQLLQLEPENPGNYVLVSNIFAYMGKWKDVEVVRTRMNSRGLKKDPACSWIEMGNKVYTFVARDKSHKESFAIYTKLGEITQRLERECGYIANTKFVLHDVREEEKQKMLHGHSERLALAFGLLHTPNGMPIRIAKNLRVCGDCHEFTKLMAKLYEREIVVRDANRFHHFRDGSCSCGDFW